MVPSHNIELKGIINPLNECEVRGAGFQGVFFITKNYKMEDWLKFECKLSPENGESLLVSDGTTMLFQIYKDGKDIGGVGIDRNDLEKLLPYLVKWYYEKSI
jgi:hypothetical protein